MTYLQRLMYSASCVSDDELRRLRDEGGDLYTKVAAVYLQLGSCEVLAIERAAVKEGLFARMYSVRMPP